MARRDVTPIRFQETKALRQSIEQIAGRYELAATRGDLDSERQPVEMLDQSRDVRFAPCSACTTCACFEERERRLCAERPDRVHAFALEPERFARRDDETQAITRIETCTHERRRL